MKLIPMLFTATSLATAISAQSGQTIFAITDTGPLANLTRQLDAWTLPPAVPTPMFTTLTLPPALPAADLTAVATLGSPDVGMPPGALVVLGTPSLDDIPGAEIHVLGYAPGAATLTAIQLNINLPGTIAVKDLHRTDTGCVLVLCENAVTDPIVFRASVTPNGVSVAPLSLPLTGAPASVTSWNSIGNDLDGNMLLAGQTSTGAVTGAAFSASTQGGALSQVTTTNFIALAIDADIFLPASAVHVGGAPMVTPAGSFNTFCVPPAGPSGGAALGPINIPSGAPPVIQDLEVVAGPIPGLLTPGAVFGSMLVAMSAVNTFTPQGARSNSQVFSSTVPPCPMTTPSLAPIFAYPTPPLDEANVIRKIALWDAMNTYGCECPIVNSGGRPVITGTVAGTASAIALLGSTYNVGFAFDAPGIPAGLASSTLHIGTQSQAIPIFSPVNGGTGKTCDILNNFFDPTGIVLPGLGVPTPGTPLIIGFPIPNNPDLSGTTLNFQWVSAVGTEIVSSPGLFVTIQ